MEPTDILYTFEENERITREIAVIMETKVSRHVKIRRLCALQEKAGSPLSKSHIDYYLRLLKSERQSRIAHIICTILVMVYLTFTLCRIFWYYHPQYNPLASFAGISLIDAIIWVDLLALAVVIYHVSDAKNHTQKR